MYRLIQILTLNILILLSCPSWAQQGENPHVSPKSKKEIKRQRKIQKKLAKDRAKVEKDRKKRESAEYDRARKRHDAIQSTETRKRMKKRRKNAGKNYGKRKPSLWKRIFGKKKRRRKR